MKMLWIKTQIHKFDSVKDFFSEFHIGKGDLIFTRRFNNEQAVYQDGTDADVLYLRDFGKGEPTNVIIDKIFDAVKGKDYKRIIAIGGGSVIDIAKLMVFDTNNKVVDLFEKIVPLRKQRELVIVPTTCGAGSEVTNLSIAEIVEQETKMGLASDHMYADDAVLIPELVKSLPYKFFLFSSVDALIHAVEAYVSPRASEYTELFSEKSAQKIISGYKTILQDGEETRFSMMEDFLIASNYAGIAFGNAGVGAVHALSYPLGGNYHVPHGEANYQFFIEVFKAYDAKNPSGKIRGVKQIISQILGVSEDAAFEALGELIDSLIARKALNEYGMKESEIEEFADSVIANQQRLLVNNYVELTRNEIRDIYKKLF